MTEKEMAVAGEFLREYGKTHFIVVSEALSIGRVKWSMIPIGKNGQENIDFYMTTQQMNALCREIINGTFAKKADADAANSYPSAYQYVTGQNGALKLNIGGGKIGIRINMKDPKVSASFYQVAVSLSSLENMADFYLQCTGKKAVSPNSYSDELLKAFEEGRIKRNAEHKKVELTDSVDVQNALEEAAPTEAQAPKADVKKENVEPKTESKAEPKKEEKKTEEPKDKELRNFTVILSGLKTEQDGFYIFKGKSEGEDVRLMFRIGDAKQLNWFDAFESSCAEKTPR